MKILWISEFDMPSGFARVSKALIKNLQKEFDITVLDWYAEKDGFHAGVKVLGKKSKDDHLAIGRFMDIYSSYDAIFILNDVWNIAKYLKALISGGAYSYGNQNFFPALPKIITYFPVDAKNHNPEWYSDFRHVYAPVTYTEFARQVISQCAPQFEERLHVIPHGIDSDIFFKSMSSKPSIREYLYKSKELSDAFIFMNANRNQPRKKLDITVMAFAAFLKKTKATNAFLHLHCGLQDYGVNIVELIKRFGVSERIIITGETSGMQNISSEMLNLYYNSADVGLNSSLGEGWGLVGMEHAITGAPQIVPAHSACEEVFGNKALLVKCPTETVFYETITVGRIPDYKHMAQCMEKYYTDVELREKHGQQLMEHFSQPEFSWKNISGKFKALFHSIKIQKI